MLIKVEQNATERWIFPSVTSRVPCSYESTKDNLVAHNIKTVVGVISEILYIRPQN